MAVEKLLRIMKDKGEAGMRAVCADLKVPSMFELCMFVYLFHFISSCHDVMGLVFDMFLPESYGYIIM